MESLFTIANSSVLPCWILLLVAPQWRWTQLVCALFMPLALGSLYIWLLSAGMGEGGFGSLPEVMQLFSNPRTVFAGWVHYLAFDLFIGAWQTRDALQLRISRWLVAPCLIATFMLGPIGLLAYLLLTGFIRNKWEPGV